ncbi:[FeFe] hydrogenase H-cluster maturation GTPase HydF [Desulfoscipio geothermicus]|uniref:[FeFe] hydrogenase H-cluster maturation GTPase HydF n=1 Tax=Desulfoscipio geothermicus DSM 3669 TaxID=1121426 RepID=A0A1I6EEB7_9FIRM|nr:[FeFe] hydrogenase H-cluster maturation GTPase HydF [Desulfoscipio geothermicus]SFR16106.1 [FeFe] hydrogenase H-cluster maturation GTPase HydF [Desulfoscipio geothermicus DSM 3669]
MHETPRGGRLHIALFGRRNAGKSSLINALTGQELAIVSPVAGTTTDPVYKAMEILPIGPVMFIDTAGLDDEGELGEKRVAKSLAVLAKADLVLLVVDPQQNPGEVERTLIEAAGQRQLPVVGVLNKIDLLPETAAVNFPLPDIPWVKVSARTGRGISQLKQTMVQLAPKDWTAPTIAGDLVPPGELALLVVPIDLAAPKGRLILPQVQTIRDMLDHDCLTMVVKERELKAAFNSLQKPPALVITDSQAFLKVDADTPPGVPLTSFSILFARYKGDLATLVAGAVAVEDLQPGDRVLIAEACTHHRVADDIGTVKIPRWLRQIVGGELQFEWSSGIELPAHLEQYRLIVHCGACMTNRREMLSRIMTAQAAGVPMVNYGVLIAYVHGILRRALAPFPDVLALLDENEVI